MMVINNDENIGNYGYIGTSIYEYNGGYFEKKISIDLK